MHVAQKCPAVLGDMHKNKDPKYVACSKLYATYFRAGFEA